MQQQKLRIALLAGGTSGEREVSLNGAAQVEDALSKEKYDIRRFDPATDLPALVAAKEEIDFALIILHGQNGEDGTVQGLLDLLSIPYQGSGVLGSAIAMDKHLAKELYRLEGLPVADWEILTPEHAGDVGALVDRLGLPLVVKPVREGSSLGMTIAKNAKELAAGIDLALARGRQVMVEKYIRGRELTVGVLGNETVEALPVIEIVPGEEFAFFDYTAKYKPGATNEICPAPVDEETTRMAKDYAVRAHRVLRLKGYSRTDMMLDAAGNLYLLETNTIPGMTATRLLPQAAKEHGLAFPDFLDRLIALGLEK